MKNAFDAVMFDLDGTLADTLADIAAAANHALISLGRPAIELLRYRYLAGQGLEYLITHALESAPDTGSITDAESAITSDAPTDLASQIQLGMDHFKDYYKDHSLDQTSPFDGMPRVLDELTKRQIPICVLSNKPHHATCDVVEKVFGQWSFDRVLGHVEGKPLKPDPTTAIELANEMNIEPASMLYVGDTRVDMETAKGAGFYAVGVLWGFRDEPELRQSGADVIVKHPLQLLDVFDGTV